MTVAPSVPPAEICLDVRRGGTTVQMAWPVDVVASPPRQNSCRLLMMLNLGATRMRDGTVRRRIQEQGGGAVVAAGERRDRRVIPPFLASVRSRCG